MESPLAVLHRKTGAKMEVWFGCALPDDFGDWQAEYEFARKSVALIDKNYRAYVSLSGPDRVRYLNAVLTNDVKGLAENRGAVSLLLNPQGHILAEIETYALQKELFCVSHAMIRERLIAWLDKYIIMDDVTMSDQSGEYATLGVEGPRAAEVARRVSGTALTEMAELQSKEGMAGAIPCHILKRSMGGVTGAEFVVQTTQVEALWNVLSEAVKEQRGGAMGYTALNALRLEQGVPWFGYDFGEKQIPHEAGLQQSHISYSKGCYTGQEIVERVRSRGQTNRVRVLLKFAGTGLPLAGEALLAEGKEIGSITRAGFSPALQTEIGMGYVRRERSAIGSELESAHGTATIIEEPLASEKPTVEK
ncbi:MAG: glycine cleavage system aminomethyltransferase GcvT [Candidatus Acidiferrum sp.]